jgi:hypothetical protein
MLAAFGATGRLESPGQSALRGVKGLANAPELAELTDVVRDQLLDAARGAAISAASSSIGSLTDRLNDQSEALRKPAGDVAGGVSKAAGLSSSDEEDDGKADQAEEAEGDNSADEEQPRRRQPVSAGRSSTGNGHDEGAERRRRPARDTGDDGELKTRSQRRTARVGDDGGGSPVRRKG